jgi:ABC-type antimicrobial peptide transport system permease subunit
MAGRIVHTKEPPERLAKTVGHEIGLLGRGYSFWTETIAKVVSQQSAKKRVTAMRSGFFAFLVVLLACIGRYGRTSYTVTRRTREIGIRAALRARRVSVLWMALRERLVLALFGIATGVPSALLAT